MDGHRSFHTVRVVNFKLQARRLNAGSLYGFPNIFSMKPKPLLLKSLFLVVFLFSFYHSSFAQNSTSTKTPMYYKVDSKTGTITPIGERSDSTQPDSTKVNSNTSFSFSAPIIIALIIGTVLSVAFSSLEKKKEIEFRKWNLKNREKLRGNKK